MANLLVGARPDYGSTFLPGCLKKGVSDLFDEGRFFFRRHVGVVERDTVANVDDGALIALRLDILCKAGRRQSDEKQAGERWNEAHRGMAPSAGVLMIVYLVQPIRQISAARAHEDLQHLDLKACANTG
ncbi:MAG TPA: hypothetical protein VGD57_06325 [Candidatus Dormibacteraeota bacterium]